MGRKLILHIGSEKTGSSYLQNFLHINKETLAEHGIIYPVSEHEYNHSNLAFLVSNEILKPEEFDDGVGIENLENVRKIIEDSPQDSTVIISSEHFHSRCVSDSIDAVFDMISDIPATLENVVIYLRDQTSLLVSSYSTSIMSGSTAPFDISEANAQSPYFNYFMSCCEWDRVFSGKLLTIRSYNFMFNGDIVKDFFSIIFSCHDKYLNILSECKYPEKDFHSRMNAPRIDLLRAMNNNLNNDDRLQFIGLLKDLPILSNYSFIDKNDIDYMNYIFHPINRDMCRKFNLDLGNFPAASPSEITQACLIGKGELIAEDYARLSAHLWSLLKQRTPNLTEGIVL